LRLGPLLRLFVTVQIQAANANDLVTGNDEVLCQFSNQSLTSVEQGARRIGYVTCLILKVCLVQFRSPGGRAAGRSGR
jgi:hypothetical protein